jgi:hypothetical protein
VGFAPFEKFRPVLSIRNTYTRNEINFTNLNEFIRSIHRIEVVDIGYFQVRYQYNSTITVIFGKCPEKNPWGDVTFKQIFDNQRERVVVVNNNDLVSLMKNDVYLISYFTELPFLQVFYKNTAQGIFSAFSDHFKLHFILKNMKLKKNMDFIRFLLEKHSKTVLEGLRIIRHKDEL